MKEKKSSQLLWTVIIQHKFSRSNTYHYGYQCPNQETRGRCVGHSQLTRLNGQGRLEPTRTEWGASPESLELARENNETPSLRKWLICSTCFWPKEIDARELWLGLMGMNKTLETWGSMSSYLRRCTRKRSNDHCKGYSPGCNLGYCSHFRYPIPELHNTNRRLQFYFSEG